MPLDAFGTLEYFVVVLDVKLAVGHRVVFHSCVKHGVGRVVVHSRQRVRVQVLKQFVKELRVVTKRNLCAACDVLLRLQPLDVVAALHQQLLKRGAFVAANGFALQQHNLGVAQHGAGKAARKRTAHHVHSGHVYRGRRHLQQRA
ncbi:hypothetical protein [Samia cynthia nucleopolyhedrovirus]|nr:hypothetical protein [Antheraea yamamai nucleopolyhedrovirus]BBD50663.1 hypothetical protein [Samia cynthia nucleopolyhedrovirus]